MLEPNINVYSGEDALLKFYDPDQCPPLPLVELPERLNHLRKDGVRIYAKLMSDLPAANVKVLPALNMLLRGKENGKITNETHTIVEYSSGSTVISLAILARIMGITNVHAYMSNKTSMTKLDLLRFYGLNLTLFGGPSQPEPLDPNGGIFQATIDGKKPGFYNPDQYSNFENFEAHIRWTGPQILRQLPDLRVFAASMGTSGTMTGNGLYLKKHSSCVKRLGICTAPGDRVPGPRTFSLLAPVEFPWKDAVDGIEEIASPESFEKSLELCRNGLLVGPSSGLALLGLLKYLDREKEKGRLDDLRNDSGEIPCVFICCDKPYQYISEYMDKLGSSYFHPVRNAELLDVDLYRTNVDWEVSPNQAYSMLFGPDRNVPKTNGVAQVNGAMHLSRKDSLPNPDIVVLDFRDKLSYLDSHIPGSLNIPLDAKDDPNPYQHPETMVKQFGFLDDRLSSGDPDFGRPLEGKTVLTLSHLGQTGRLAMSILRNRGVNAHAVVGGSERWKESGKWGNWRH